MKIGILTHPLQNNYGGILQNYALQTILLRMGHQPLTLRVGNSPWYYRKWMLSIGKTLLKKCIGLNATFFESPHAREKRRSGMERFINTYIQATPRQKWYNKKQLRKNGIECLLVGSDQVWRPSYNQHVEDHFLRFASDVNLLKVAYAASFGSDQWEFTPEQTAECRQLIQQFKAVSVREKRGVTFCRKYLDCKAEWVLDPTFLLSVDDYLSLCTHISPSAPFVFAYILDDTPTKRNFCEQIATNAGLPLRFVTDSTRTAEDSPERWLACFRDATLVITDSFHGTVFSLIFEKDFLTFCNSNRGKARFDSLVEIFGIDNHIVSQNDSLPSNIPHLDITQIHACLEKEKLYSLDYLSNVLKY